MTNFAANLELMHKTILPLIVLLFTLIGCNDTNLKTSGDQRSFCYWDRNYGIDTAMWNQSKANHLYIRYFDVDWDFVSQQAKPIASVLQQPSYDGKTLNDTLVQHFTPSVFITNRVFEKSTNQQLDSLSARLKRRVDQLNASFAETAYYKRENKKGYDDFENYDDYQVYIDSMKTIAREQINNRYTDVLIDCDWAEGTKDKFFYFLNQIKKDFGTSKQLSVTLRLWQYKATKTAGVPPADRCLLMCYNMQNANNFKIENSIATIDELKKYVSGDQYPISLDIALPIFNWGVLFRNEKFVGLLGNVDTQYYEDNIIEFEKIEDNRFRLLDDMVIGDFFARKGDIIRVETVSQKTLNKMVDYLKSEIKTTENSRVTFFSWNNIYINNYGTDELQTIYATFSK